MADIIKEDILQHGVISGRQLSWASIQFQPYFDKDTRFVNFQLLNHKILKLLYFLQQQSPTRITNLLVKKLLSMYNNIW